MKKSTSAGGFLRRTTLAALITGLIAALATAYHWGGAAGSAFLAGLLWGLANFLVLGLLLREVAPGETRVLRVAGLAGLKLGVLYPLAIVVLLRGLLPPLGLVAGFSWVLLVLALRALGELWWSRTQEASSLDDSLTEIEQRP